MNMKKNVAAAAMIALAIGATNVEVKATMKEEEMQSMSLQNYTYWSTNRIVSHEFTEEDFYQMKKTVQNYDLWPRDHSIEYWTNMMSKLVYIPKRIKCSEEIFNNIVIFSKILHQHVSEIDEKMARFSSMILDHLARAYLYYI